MATREDRLRSAGARKSRLSGWADPEDGEEHRLRRMGRPAVDIPDTAEDGFKPAAGHVAVQGRRPDRPVAVIVPDGGRSHHDAEPGGEPAQRTMDKILRGPSRSVRPTAGMLRTASGAQGASMLGVRLVHTA